MKKNNNAGETSACADSTDHIMRGWKAITTLNMVQSLSAVFDYPPS